MSAVYELHRNVRRRSALSRRACLGALAAAAVAPMALPATAQIDWHKLDIWQSYRREDLGFEVEMPGDPEIEEEEDEYGRSINAELLFIGMMFAAGHVTSTHPLTVDQVVRQQHAAAQTLKGKITREARYTLDGLPAIEINMEIEGTFASIMRSVVIGNRAIAITVTGWPDVADNASAQRFLNSFKLLPPANSR